VYIPSLDGSGLGSLTEILGVLVSPDIINLVGYKPYALHKIMGHKTYAHHFFRPPTS